MTSDAYNKLYDVALHCFLLCFLNCDVLHSMILLCCCVVICGVTVWHPVAMHGDVSYSLTLCCVVVYGVCVAIYGIVLNGMVWHSVSLRL